MKNKKHEIIIIGSILALTLASMIMGMVLQWVDTNNRNNYSIPIWQVVVTSLAVVGIYSISQMDRVNKENIKNKFQKEHYLEIETLLTASRIERHEYRKHLQALQSCLHLGMVEEAVHYLEGISRQPESEDYLPINHPALFGLVNSKYALARTQGIEMGVSVECDLSDIEIEPWDLCSIVGNLLDNAQEAAAFEKGIPRVGLEFRRREGFFEITVTNNGRTIEPGQAERIFEAGFSTKENSGRGYGLYIVKSLVEGYGGKIELMPNNKTVVRIMFPEEGYDRQVSQKNSLTHSRQASG